jgi:hypothetical protein
MSELGRRGRELLKELKSYGPQTLSPYNVGLTGQQPGECAGPATDGRERGLNTHSLCAGGAGAAYLQRNRRAQRTDRSYHAVTRGAAVSCLPAGRPLSACAGLEPLRGRAAAETCSTASPMRAPSRSWTPSPPLPCAFTMSASSATSACCSSTCADAKRASSPYAPLPTLPVAKGPQLARRRHPDVGTCHLLSTDAHSVYPPAAGTSGFSGYAACDGRSARCRIRRRHAAARRKSRWGSIAPSSRRMDTDIMPCRRPVCPDPLGPSSAAPVLQGLRAHAVHLHGAAGGRGAGPHAGAPGPTLIRAT